MSSFRLFAVLALAPVLAGFTQPPVSPEHTLRYTRERGGSCTVMVPYYGPQVLWIGRVAGGAPMDRSAERDFVDWREDSRCFFEEADCQVWVTGVAATWRPPGYAYCVPASRSRVTRGGRGPVKP
jgi:hypothetical protein